MLLNNDAVVTDGWLDQLIALANARATADGNGEGTTEHTEDTEGDGGREGTTNQTNLTNGREVKNWDEIGLVGPMSNYASPPQLVENVPYRDMEEMQGFAGAGETSIAGSGSRRASCPGSACS